MPSKWSRYNEALWLTTRLWRGWGHLRPRGPENGRPVLVLPGFLTSDRSSMELRRAFAEAGWRAYPWGLGVNKGVFKEILDAIIARVMEIHDIHKEPVLIVGWSLGGLFAREVARHIPECVEAVVTLGSPIAGDLHENNVWMLYEWITGHRVDNTPVPRVTRKPPAPTLAIWSRNDGLIPPHAARGTEAERDKAVEIPSTHMGFGISYIATRMIVNEVEKFLEEYYG